MLTDRSDGGQRSQDEYNGFEYNFNARLPHGITLFGGGTSERTLAQLCDERWNPNLLLYCDQRDSGLPFRTQFKFAGSVPIVWGIQVGVSFQSLPGYRYGLAGAVGVRRRVGSERPALVVSLQTPNGSGTVWLITPTTHLRAAEPAPCVAQGKCTAGQLVDPGMTQSSLSVPLVAPMTEYGDRINQLDLNIVEDVHGRAAAAIQPKIDFFNVLNSSAVYAVRTSNSVLNYGTASYMQPIDHHRPRVPAGWFDSLLASRQTSGMHCHPRRPCSFLRLRTCHASKNAEDTRHRTRLRRPTIQLLSLIAFRGRR